MTSKIHSAIPYGFEHKIITIEGDANNGLPCFNIVGMASKTISESRERIRSALTNSGFSFPRRKIIINLAPAELEKTGTSLDLPIALAILSLSMQILQQNLKHRLFAGELSLTGDIRPVRGIINIIEAAQARHFKEIFIPADNADQAALVADGNCKIYPVQNLREL
jgi:magnesium chelatase family protein